ncbi:hypothetical protein ILUMI_13658 [Ignelater luminosus]|uniref:Uncharacterized protein n=1 Tax=Ignelater luminosus TaxID=2038154 RepID=A0A8K0GAP9_IGNLU|nr:hypothetical protein ILUMI_13658 [Ignelater luminosus]
MKILVIFGLLVAYTQATSEPVTVQNRIKQAQIACIQENGWDANEIKELSKNDILPEDNDKFNNFVYCYWKKLDVIDENGVINVPQIKIMIPHLIRDRYPNISENDAAELADRAVAECKGKTSTANSFGQSCVQLRNCVVRYVKERQD